MKDIPFHFYDTPEPQSATPSNLTCDYCNDHIYFGYDYYDFDGTIVCEDCLSYYTNDHKHEMEESEPDYDF